MARHTQFLLPLAAVATISCGGSHPPPGETATSDVGSPTDGIVSSQGYDWPDAERDYWPTEGWRRASPQDHGLDVASIEAADAIAANDDSFRSLLIVRDGYLVFERYYHGGGPERSTEVWSVTKSFMSVLIGIALDKGHIRDVEDRVVDYLPRYPDFDGITIKHVLTHTTGLDWDEQSLQAWIQSSDWIAAALGRGRAAAPGEALLYSSGNSHFLSGLIRETTGRTPGEFAKEHLFDPIGIELHPLTNTTIYTDWSELHEPLPGSWRKGNMGLEIGAFGLHLTAREMANFGFLMLNRGEWEGERIVSRQWVEESTRDHERRSETVGIGYHWMVYRRAGHDVFDADGWGGQSISVIPDLDMVVVTKCDAVNPRNTSSYRVLELVLEAGRRDRRS